MSSSAIPMPSRIVIRGTNWVGDTVMSIPALKELRRLFPDAHLTLWIRRGLEDLVSIIGIADDILTVDYAAEGALSRVWNTRRELSQRRFDMAVLFQNAFESAFTARIAAVPWRVGYPTDGRGLLLNVKVPLTAEILAAHQVYYYLGIVRHLGTRFYGETVNPPADCSISLPSDVLDRGREVLASKGIHPNEPIYCLCPGSVNSDAKRWPAEHYARLADMLMERQAARIVFLGAPGERSLIDGIIDRMNRSGAVNPAGELGMPASMAIMNLSRAVISNDTGSAHLAVAASATVFTIFGPTVAAATAPFGPNAHVIQGEAVCAPCRHTVCPKPRHECMAATTPDAVFERVVGNGQ